MERNDGNVTVRELKNYVKKFIKERDWEKYHNPKDVAESVCIEAAELLELFQWRNVEEIRGLMENEEFRRKIAEELADVIIYSLSMADVTKTDLTQAIAKKLEKNESKYPVEKYRGKAYVDE